MVITMLRMFNTFIGHCRPLVLKHFVPRKLVYVGTPQEHSNKSILSTQTDVQYFYAFTKFEVFYSL